MSLGINGSLLRGQTGICGVRRAASATAVVLALLLGTPSVGWADTEAGKGSDAEGANAVDTLESQDCPGSEDEQPGSTSSCEAGERAGFNESPAQPSEEVEVWRDSDNRVTFDVTKLLAAAGVELPANEAERLSALSAEGQISLLLGRGAKLDALELLEDDRPMAAVAEILRVLDPSVARPEVATQAELAIAERDDRFRAHLQQLEERFPDRIGFPSLSSSGNGLVVPIVGLTPRERADLEKGRAAGSDVDVRYMPGKASAKALLSLRDELESSLTEVYGSDLGSWSIGVDPGDSRVVVEVASSGGTWSGPASQSKKPRLDEVRRHVESVTARRAGQRPSADLVSVTGVDRRKFAPVDYRGTDYRESAHIRGGEWIQTERGGCTSNFLFNRRLSGGGYEYRMGTAGHCSTTSTGVRRWQNVWHSNHHGARNGEIGRVTHNGWVTGTRSDYALFRVPSAATTRPRVMTSSGTWRPVRAVITNEGQNLAANVYTYCFVGQTLFNNNSRNKSCGQIDVVNVSFTLGPEWNNTRINGLWCLNVAVDADPGDSGGSVYYEYRDQAWAAGIIYGGDSCFTLAVEAQNRSGFDIATRDVLVVQGG